MAAVQAFRTPFQGVNYLSRNSQSSELHTPLYLDRITTNQDAYNRFIREQSAWLVKPKWGSSRLCGDLSSPRSWTSEGNKTFNFQLSHLDKNHLHFGGGQLSCGRDLAGAVEAKYKITSTKRSNVRPTDELIPDGNKINLGSSQIRLPFPAEHPYSSHTPKMAMFPSHDAPDDEINGQVVTLATPLTLSPTTASASTDTVVLEKIKGSPYRRELIRVVNDSGRKPLKWHAQTFNQLVKSPEATRQEIYPIPLTSVKPDFWDRHSSLTLSQTTANVLQNLQAARGKSEYGRQYTEHGTTSSLKLNNSNEKPLFQKKFYPGCLPEEKQTAALNECHDQVNLNSENAESPYTTTYNVDYSTQSHLQNPSTLDSPSILRKSVAHKLNLSRNYQYSNKTVTFNDKVIVSDGHHTSSVVVNDLEENEDPRLTTQSPIQRPGTPCNLRNLRQDCAVKKLTRPETAPAYQHQSHVGLSRPGATNQINPNLNEIMLRPSTAGSCRSFCRDQLFQLQNNFTKTDAHKKFHQEFPEEAPDIRKIPDTRITINERRHFIPEVGCHSYYFHG